MKNSRGFFKIIGIIVVALVILSILGFKINTILGAPAVRNFFFAIWNLVLYVINLFVQIFTFLFNALVSFFQ